MSNEHKTFAVGMAQEKITPELPCRLAGYFHERIADKVRDDIYVKAVIIDKLALVSCDLVALTEEIVSGAKSIIERECALDSEQIIICATHTHTAPEVRREVKSEWCNDAYIEKVIKTIAATVKKAFESRFEGTVHYGTTDAPEYSFNRLYRKADGSEVFGRTSDDIIGPAGPVDSSLQTIFLRDKDKEVRGVIINFACHPDVIGGGRADFVSADWPGEMAKNIAAVYGQDVTCLFLQGTAGDINQTDYLPHYMPNSGVIKAVQMGRGLAGAAMLAGEKAEAMTASNCAISCGHLELPFYTRDKVFFNKIEELKKKSERTYFEKALIMRGEEWNKDGKSIEIPVHCMRLGDIAIVGIPAEIFTAWGLEIKKYSPSAHTIIIELCDKRVSNYVPTSDQANRGAYGSIPVLSRFLEPDAGRLMVECAIENLQKLWKTK